MTAQRRLSLGLLVAAIAGALLLFAFLPRTSRLAAGQCAGRTGAAVAGRPYALTLRVDGAAVVSPVDFDGRLWQADGGRVTVDGLATPGAASMAGAVTLTSRQQATFSSPAAFATLLPLTKADGCGRAPAVRSGSALGRR